MVCTLGADSAIGTGRVDLARLLAAITLAACFLTAAPWPLQAQQSPSIAELEQLEDSLTPAEKAQVQRALGRIGLYDGAIDSAFGGGTRAAIRDFQDRIGAQATGWLTADQIQALLSQDSADILPPDQDAGGDTADAASDIGDPARDTRTVSDWVGLTDANDFYAFTLAAQATVTVALTELSADADLEVLDAEGELVGISNNVSSAAESATLPLPAGTYRIRVFPFAGSTGYRLSVSVATAAVSAPEPHLAAWEAGWNRDERRRVEQALALLGYLDGGVDGYFAAQTREAIAGFQRAQGDAATTVLTRPQRVALAVAAAEAAGRRGQEAAAMARVRAEAARAAAERDALGGDAAAGYRGETAGGVREGLGVFDWEDGTHYEGQFHANRREGHGVQYETDGDRYEGEFVADDRRGFGSFYKPDGRVWRGEFLDGPLHGFGTFVNADGFRVSGEWRRNSDGGWAFTGYGEQTPPDGEVRRGRWEASELIEPL